MKTRFQWIALIVLAVLILSGCGSANLPGTGLEQPANLTTSTAPQSTGLVPLATVATTTSQGSTEPVQPAGKSTSTSSAPPSSLQVQASEPVLNCTSPAPLTKSLTEGPYFKPNSPERSSLLEPGLTGMKLTITGYVLTTGCKPVPHALLDIWQANAQGQYDNSGYTLRGHQFTDESGRYQLETIVPGLYPGRTEHIHVKVQAPNGPVLTTQLFFPGQAQNQTDRIFDPSLVLPVQTMDTGLSATFNFVVSDQ